MTGIPTVYRENAAQIVQEIKRNMIYRRYKRVENINMSRIIYSSAANKVKIYWEYKRKNTDRLNTLLEIIRDKILTIYAPMIYTSRCVNFSSGKSQ